MKSKKMPPADLESLMPILIGVWRRFHKLSGPADCLQTREFRSVAEAAAKLQSGLETGGGLAGQDYFNDPVYLGAYLLYHWVVHYQQGLSLINEIPHPPQRVLDLCSGPAPMAFAALRHGASDVIAVDRNEAALKLGAEICGRYGVPITLSKKDCLKNLSFQGKFDLIILGHALQELFPSSQMEWQERQQAFIETLLGSLTPNGFLLLAESSYPVQNTRILSLRDALVQNEIPIQAPCIWRGECPALKAKNSPCYAQREFEKPYLIREIQRAAKINLSSLKMSYLIVKSPKSSWPELPEGEYYRIVSPPIESHYGKRYYLCGSGGKKNLGSRLQQLPAACKAFDYLRRGELISIKNPLGQVQSYDLIEGSSLKVEAAAGKAIPEIGSHI